MSGKTRLALLHQPQSHPQAAGNAVQIIDVSEHKLAPHRDEVSGAGPRRIPSAKWRELINPPSPRLRRTFGKVWLVLRSEVGFADFAK